MKVYVTLLLAIAATLAIADVPEANTESFDINKVGEDPKGECRFKPSGNCRPTGGRALTKEDGPAAAPAPLADVPEANTESFDINKVGEDPKGECRFKPSGNCRPTGGRVLREQEAGPDPNAACRFKPSGCRPGGGRVLRKEDNERAAAPAPLL